MAALARLKAVLDRHYDGHGPSFSRSLTALTAIATFLRPQLLRRGIARTGIDGPLPQTEESKSMMDISMDVAAPWQADTSGSIRTRDEAYRMLDEAARFLERTEPHSPVSLLIRRAIVWGRMPLPALLGEMMRDQALTYRLLGIEEDGPAPARGSK